MDPYNSGNPHDNEYPELDAILVEVEGTEDYSSLLPLAEDQPEWMES